MSTARSTQVLLSPKFHSAIALLMFSVVAPLARAQEVPTASVAVPASTSIESSDSTAFVNLPDAPGAVLYSSSAGSQDQQSQPTAPTQPGQPSKSVKSPTIEQRIFGLGSGDALRASHMASRTDKYILPGQLAPKLDTGDKIELGFIHGVSAYGVLGWFVSSGYSHIINGDPNYGTDKGAYGERLGAAALRGYSTELLKDSVMANAFHQDPRYYKMGPAHNAFVRAGYSVSRILVTRNDDGRLAPNYSLVSGNLVGAALTNAYYPDVNRGFGQTARTFGSAMYGSAFSFVAAEFLSGALEAVHLKQGKE
ncbi:hypothetical protein [Granulicella arctica]|uniref:hypothetical protein n=1 Tax=Granulicella arctica TaxID=940613 RepID=UPI0021E0DFE7|nr:hypothetical protein [Granulicella arctica]